LEQPGRSLRPGAGKARLADQLDAVEKAGGKNRNSAPGRSSHEKSSKTARLAGEKGDHGTVNGRTQRPIKGDFKPCLGKPGTLVGGKRRMK